MRDNYVIFNDIYLIKCKNKKKYMKIKRMLCFPIIGINIGTIFNCWNIENMKIITIQKKSKNDT